MISFRNTTRAMLAGFRISKRRGWLDSQIDMLPALTFIDNRPLDLCQVAE